MNSCNFLIYAPIFKPFATWKACCLSFPMLYKLVFSAFQCCILIKFEHFDQVADFVGAPHLKRIWAVRIIGAHFLFDNF
jgi:hypothetical protein